MVKSRMIILGAVLTMIVIFVSLFVFDHGTDTGYDPMIRTVMTSTDGNVWNMMGYSNFSWWGSGMALAVLSAIVATAALCVWLYYRTRIMATSLDTIKLRLAKGEITKTEFEQLKHDLDVK